MLNNSASGGSPTDWVVAEKRISKQGAHDVGLEEDEGEGGADDDDDDEDDADDDDDDCTDLCKPGP